MSAITSSQPRAPDPAVSDGPLSPTEGSENSELVAAAAKLSEWYSQLRPIRMDIIGDFAGSELFMIEGDSLLRHALGDALIDMNDGLQLLHAIYAVERFLAELQKRTCNFHVVFFDTHKPLCVPETANVEQVYKYFLARACIIQHLDHFSDESASKFMFHFESPKDDVFLSYLSEFRPYFIMTHDGATTHDAEESDRNASCEGQVFQGFIWNVMNLSYPVGLIHEVMFHDSKVFTSITPPQKVAAFKTHLERPLRDLLAVAEGNLLHPPAPPADLNIEKIIHNLTEELADCSACDALNIIALSQLLDFNPDWDIFAAPFLLHTVLLKRLDINQRSLSAVSFQSPEKLRDIHDFLKHFSLIQTALVEDAQLCGMLRKKQFSGIADLIDGRLFYHILAHYSNPNPPALSPYVEADFQKIMGAYQSFACKPNLPSLQGLNFNAHTEGIKQSSPSSLQVLPFSNPVFNKHLSSIKIDIEETGGRDMEKSTFERALYEAQWNIKKSTALEEERKRGMAVRLQEKKTWWQLKGDQIYQASMLRYAQSLVGGEIQPDKIIPRKENKKTTEKPTPPAKGGKMEKAETPAKKGSTVNKAEKSETTSKKGGSAGKKGKTEGLSKAEQIIAANAQSKSAKTFKKALDTWKGFYSSDVVTSKTDRSKVTVLTEFIRKSTEEIVIVEARLIKCEYLFNIWRSEFCDPARKIDHSKGYEIVALIFNEAKQIIMSPSLTKQIKAHLDGMFSALGFNSLSLSTRSDTLPSSPMTVTPSPRVASASISTKVGFGLQEFQLRYCGPYMDRNLDSREDPRVKFTPDAWQVRVLDALDEDKSIFVVAPTSAGKTFIAYYAMEKILRANDEDVLVYIAPTKALVNQIAAEVQSRFAKDYKSPGKTVWAINTGEYQIHNPQKCQILVTVPQILQGMLLSPQLASTWAPRVKRIILDEVHCIGQSEEGAVWEQLLLLSPCPIIALSATVGNPREFHEWLQLTQNKLVWTKPNETKPTKGVEVVMIHHTHRFNHLRTFYYESEDPKKKVFRGLEQQPVYSLGLPSLEESKFRFVHPVTALCETVPEIPDDLALESRDCYMLWEAMIKAQTTKHAVPSYIQPSTKWFPEIIRKADVIKWEAALKDVLKSWMLDPESPFAEVLRFLREAKAADIAKFIENNKDNDGEESEEEASARDQIETNSATATVIPTPSQALTPAMLKTVATEEVSIEHLTTLSQALEMLNQLNKLNALPALLFNYNRTMCEVLCITLVEQLVKGEEYYRKNSKEWNRKVAEREIWLKKKEEMDRRAGRLKKTSKKGQEDDEDARATREMDARSEESNPYASFDPEEPSDGFTFAGKRFCPRDELERDLVILRRAGIDNIYIEGIRRGIGIHHTGLSRPLRECVERLFRRGFLRVVIATGTLALGINMPCATVVFVTDSVDLTPLNYRQASGRAGRRGFDLLGNVVFHGIPLQRTYRLINSHLPSLMGHFPTSTTLILRLFVLLHGSDNSAHAVSLINALLSQNKLSLGDKDSRAKVLHHIRFSIEYLRRMNLLSANGEPVNFAAVAAHLNFAEPSNFIFADLLRHGVFHEVCSELSASMQTPDPAAILQSVNRKLMLILAHLFGRRPFRKSDKVERAESRSGSMVVLDDLPEKAKGVIERHNEESLKIFTTYAVSFARQNHQNHECNVLPYTQTKAGAHNTTEKLPFLQNIPPVVARSSFVALSGHTDEFKSISELLFTCRHDILLEASGVPYLPVDSETRLNAYLYDFFIHGNKEELIKVNLIGRDVVWFYLNDFSKVLATIVSSLRRLIELGPEREMKIGDVSGQADRGMGDVLEEELEKEATAAMPTATEPKLPRQDTRFIRDSDEPVTGKWDEENLSESEEEEPWDEEEANANRQALLKVLKGFTNLQTEFNTKFSAIFATKADAVRAAKKHRVATKAKKPMLVKR